MTTEYEIQDEEKPDPVLTALKAIQEEQVKQNNRLGYLQRQVETRPQGQPADPALLREIASLRTQITSQALASMNEEEQRDYYKKQAEDIAPLNAEFCDAAGIDMTPEMKKHLDTEIAMEIHPHTGAVNPASYLKEAQQYMRAQHKIQQEAQAKTSPAEEAGEALGDGSRGAGVSTKRTPTWAQAQKITKVSDLSDEAYEALIK